MLENFKTFFTTNKPNKFNNIVPLVHMNRVVVENEIGRDMLSADFA